MNPKEQLHSIQQLSTKLNIPKPTLRFWEKEFEGILLPLRTNGGQRRYTSEIVSIIGEIKALKKAGLSLVEIKRRLGKRLMSEAGSQTCPQRSRHARHREAQPRRTGLRGGRGSGDGRTDGIDFLAERVAEVVNMEALRLFQQGEGSST
jgi:DNA-binding transcriptional MerR regulator